MKKRISTAKDLQSWNFIIFLTLSLMLIVGITSVLRQDSLALYSRSKAASGQSAYQELLAAPSFCQTDETIDYEKIKSDCLAKNNKNYSGYRYNIRWQVNYHNNGDACTATPVCVTTLNSN